MGNIITDGSTAGWLPDAKIDDPDRDLDHPEWQISAADFNLGTDALDVIASHLVGEPDGAGAWFIGGYGQTADPLTATLAGLGTGRWHAWPDATDDAWKFRVSGVTAERLLFDDQGIGVLKLDSYTGVTLAPSGKMWLRNNAGTLQTSYNGGAWASVGGGGGGITDADDVTWTGEHSFEGISFNVNPLATFHAGIAMDTADTLVVGANTLIGSVADKLNAAHLAIASQAIGDILQADGTTTFARLAAVATGNALISGGVGTVSSWGKIGLTTHISGTLAAANGGTGQGGGYAVGDMLYASGASALSKLAAVATGQVLISQGVTTAPVWSADATLDSLTLTSTMRLASNASDRKYLEMGAAAASASYRGIMGQHGSGTDKAGGDLRMVAGLSTGSAASGDFEIWHGLRTSGSDAVLNTAVMTWEFTAPTDVGDGTGVAHSDLLPGVTAKNNLGSTSKRLVSGYFDSYVFANRIGSADDTNSYWEFDESDGASITLGGTSRHKVSATFARYAFGAAYADSSAFEVTTNTADARGRFQTTSSTGVGGIISTNDNSWSGTMLIDGSSTTRTGVAGNTYFVGLTSQAHFGALTNTDSHWITGTADSTADRVASAVYNSGNRYLRIGYFTEYSEMSAPAAGAANTARVFAVDNGSGKTVLKCQFATGAAQVMATEP